MWSDRSIPRSSWEEGAAPSLQGFLWNVGTGGGARLLCVSWFVLWFYGLCFGKVLLWGWVGTRRAVCAPQNSWQLCGGWLCSPTNLGSCQEKEAAGSSRGAHSAELRESLLPQGSRRSSVTLTLVAGPASLQGRSGQGNCQRQQKVASRGFQSVAFLGRSPRATCSWEGRLPLQRNIKMHVRLFSPRPFSF